MKIWSVALLAAAALGGCSSEEEGGLTPAPLPECPDHDYRACDTRSASCQARLLSLAACVYGAETPQDLPVQVISEAEFREVLEEQFAAEQAGRSDEELAATELLESALVDLRLVEPGALTTQAQVDTYVENLAGVYLDAETGVVLIDHGRAEDDPEADAVLVHEFIHALQDVDYDLDSWFERYRGTTDSLLAARSVTEGQATYYQFRVGLAMLGHHSDQVDFDQTLRNLRRDLDESARSAASPYLLSAATFPYAYGGTLAARDWEIRGQSFISPLMEDPPRSTHEVIEWVSDGFTPVPPVELSEPPAIGEYALLDQDVLGAWLLEIMATKFGAGTQTARDAARGWSADRLLLYRDASDQRAWLWQLELGDTHAPAAAALADIADLLAAALPETVTIEHGWTRLFVASGDGEEAPPELLEAGRAFLEAD